MPDHGTVERRSLRYHDAIARRILEDATVLQRARTRVERWIHEGTVAAFYARGWQRILALPTDELRAFLVERSERATAFRQVSPFAGVLTARERWRLWAAPDDDDDATAA
jgi:hypothetical protein